MRRSISFLAVLSLSITLISCTRAPKSSDGYDIEIATYFRSSDAGWASKWKELDGGLRNIDRHLGEDQGSYLLIHVSGVDPVQQDVSALCVVFISGPPSAGPCVLEKAHPVFAPVKIVNVETANDLLRGEMTIKATVGVRPTSWLWIEPRTVGSIELELPT